MNDLISRSALLERLAFKRMGSMQRNTYPGLESAIAQVKKAPAVDAVEVVRCKDCKHSYKGSPHGLMCECPVGGQNTSLLGGDDFCSCGERRADDADRTET